MSSARLWNTRSIYKKTILFLYSGNEKTENETENKLLLRSKRIKYLNLNLTKVIQNFYSENYATLLKESKGNLNRWRRDEEDGEKKTEGFPIN